MKGIGTIELIGMEFHAYHGCLEDEKRDGNLFVVDFRGEADLFAAAKSDELADTQDYGQLYQIIGKEMAKPSDLLEHVAGRIVTEIEKNMPGFIRFSVAVSKKNPPVGGVCAWSRVVLEGGSATKRRGR